MRHSNSVRVLVVAGLLAMFGCNKSATTTDSGNSSAPAAGNSASAPMPPSAPGGNSASTTMPAPPPAPGESAARESAPAPVAPVRVHAGTTLTVTVDQTISSKTSNPGDHFDASLAAPVMV